MVKKVINIENLSKVYKRPIKIDGKNIKEDFWALRDLSLTVEKGDVLGVIGSNGAGKSTLLKILSKITSPTTGNITINGRVGSLLEVGTGFHPEMTGRENIFMNGSILGMSKSEIVSKLDEIIEFSGISDFLETPVKRYSSGMQTRLAFAVAAHLEPEVLIIDEVLAVGDAAFQKKCLGKMGEIRKSGRTILFVSHNMNAIKNLCNKCIWLKNGRRVEGGEQTHDVVKRYMTETVPSNDSTIWSAGTEDNTNSEFIEFVTFRLVDADDNLVSSNLQGNEIIYVAVDFIVKQLRQDYQIGFALYDSYLNLIFLSYSTDHNKAELDKFSKGRNTIKVQLPLEILNDGDYSLQLIAGIHNINPILPRIESKITISFTVVGNPDRSNNWNFKRNSMVAPILNWNKSSRTK